MYASCNLCHSAGESLRGFCNPIISISASPAKTPALYLRMCSGELINFLKHGIHNLYTVLSLSNRCIVKQCKQKTVVFFLRWYQVACRHPTHGSQQRKEQCFSSKRWYILHQLRWASFDSLQQIQQHQESKLKQRTTCGMPFQQHRFQHTMYDSFPTTQPVSCPAMYRQCRTHHQSSPVDKTQRRPEQ